MQRNQLGPQKILAGRNTSRDGDGLIALVGNQAIDTPFCAVECVLGDFEPATADARVRLGVADFLHVGHDRALVRGINHVVGARRQCVAPREGCFGSGLQGDDSVGFGRGVVGWAIAGYRVCGYVVDGLYFCIAG